MLHIEGRERGGCARAAPSLLSHLSLLFVLYGGALLATAARLKWDPSTYVVVRELLPTEYRVLCASLPPAGVLLLALAHLALCALTARPQRRATLYLTYAVSLGLAVVVEVSVCVWATLRVRAWLATDVARHLQETLQVREHLLGLLAALEHWHPLPNQIKALLQEAEEDLPWNGYVSCACAGVLLAAQLAALALAIIARRAALRESKLRQQTPGAYSYSGNGVDRPRQALLDVGLS